MNKDVIARSSVLLDDWRNIPKQSDIKKSSVETYDKRQQVFDLFLKGANNMVLFAYSRKMHALKWVNEEEKCFSFPCDMVFQISLCFML